ncbi:MAG TPA: hypothetical protein VMV49_13070 [Candidatus Deferrimicrobium sp.]|nr:hypothetical protein [Candidatus Deferrimicrobium sp.]
MPKNEDKKGKERILRIAYEALEECNTLYERTGRNKIPLDEVAGNLAISKEEIQNSFDQLVQEGVIGDDGDREHMNYDESGALMELILQLLTKLLKEKEESKEEKEENLIQYT